MNILGKILVFLNLVFALVVGGFLLIDFQTRTNWKKAYDDLKREMTVAKQNNEVQNSTIKKLGAKVDEQTQKLSEEQEKHRKAKDQAAKDIAAYKLKMDKEMQLVTSTDLNINKFKTQAEALQQENKTLSKLVDIRDASLLKLEQEKDKYFKEAQQALNERDLAISRLASLQDQHKVLTLKFYETQVAKKGGKGSGIKDKNAPNPPPFYIKGIIEQVDTEDNALVLISLGKDNGIEVGHTLEVFRKTPSAKYLGLLRIEEVTAHKAVARLVPNPYAAPVTLKKDDQVASQILPGY